MSSPAPATTKGVRLPRSQRRAQLLDVARSVFVRSGYHSASMDEIADQAGVSKPVLYQHFPGKLDLYLALLEGSCASLIEAIDSALNSTDVNHDRVRAIIAAYFAFVDDPDKASRLVFESDLTQERAVRSLIDDANNRCAVLIGEVIADETGLDSAQALLLGFSLVGLAQTSARAWLAGGPTLDREQAQTLAASLAWRGISDFPKGNTIKD
ncbi:MAG: TetR/AcrR family transcriptional regulator [Actinomycetes bacterium]